MRMKEFASLKLDNFRNIKSNFHTHTTRCKHAVGTEREYVEKAIEAGFKVLGFSDHAPYLFEDGHVSRIRMDMSELENYVHTIEHLKEEYAKDIQLFVGLEMEYFPKLFDRTIEKMKQYPLDYLILGQHYFDDETGYIYTGTPREGEVYLETYVERITSALDTGYFLYVAHPDIINYIGPTQIYEKYMRQIVQLLKKHNMPIEVNVNGYRANAQYPNPRFMEIGVEEGCDFIMGVDAHDPKNLTDYRCYDGCVQMIEKLGGNIICR